MLTGDMLRRSAKRFPDKPAVLWQDTVMSYGALDAQANQLANALLALDLPKGSKIGIISTNRPEYAVAFFGVARTGYVLVNISVLYAEDELTYVLDKADVKILLFQDVFGGKVLAIKDGLPKLSMLVSLGGNTAWAVSFDDFINGHAQAHPATDLSENDPFCMTYTGGTTGRPKGVLFHHKGRAITAHTVMVEEAIDERDVVGVVTPMFHVAALNIMFQPAILAGATVAFLSKWSVEGFRELARKTKMSAAFMVPTQVSMVVSDESFDAADFQTWKKLSFAGAPMPDWVQRAIMEKLPDLKLTQIYGQSEMGVVAVLRHWYLPGKLGAVGRQPYNIDVAVVNQDGNPVAPGEIGEVVSRGDNVMLEYYREPEQTAAFFHLSDGWGWTGDLATIDDEGFITLIDRSKDMIISGGENIYPKEIEDALYLHDAVRECAVFGIPHEKWGEVPAAYVALKSGETVSAEDLEKHCTGLLAQFKRPQLIEFVEDFPKTPIGKIQKNILRKPYWKAHSKLI
jgi:acyl-CoA synthetase (AMP-forming)/AMP-acid ligase II